VVEIKATIKGEGDASEAEACGSPSGESESKSGMG